jgi:nitroreductase/NAD-dependent dihydropyrimidine dehydrogenase PreA subunit
MPIIGIDIAKCSNCKSCINECVFSNFSVDENNEEVIFDATQGCILCGHCIIVCPENAIVYKDMKDEVVPFESVQEPSSLVSYEKMHKLMRAKRSIRQYKKKKVPKEVIKKVLESMRYAPTGVNIRNLKCTIISDEKVIDRLSNLITDVVIQDSGETPLLKKKEQGIDPIFYHAPQVIILHSDKAEDIVNATIAITYGMLSAETLGLGTCWMGITRTVLNMKKEIREGVAGIRGVVLGVMTIGYPAVKYLRVPPRPELKTKGLD